MLPRLRLRGQAAGSRRRGGALVPSEERGLTLTLLQQWLPLFTLALNMVRELPVGGHGERPIVFVLQASVGGLHVPYLDEAGLEVGYSQLCGGGAPTGPLAALTADLLSPRPRWATDGSSSTARYSCSCSAR